MFMTHCAGSSATSLGLRAGGGRRRLPGIVALPRVGFLVGFRVAFRAPFLMPLLTPAPFRPARDPFFIIPPLPDKRRSSNQDVAMFVDRELRGGQPSPADLPRSRGRTAGGGPEAAARTPPVSASV